MKKISYGTAVVPEAEFESHNRGFVPVQPRRQQTIGLLYTPFSSGTASPVSHSSQLQLYEHVSSQSPRILPSQKRAVPHDAE